MALTQYRKRVERTQFRKLGKGAPYLLASNLAAAPRLKLSRTGYLGGWSTITGAPTETAEADLSVAVVKVPQAFLGANNANR